MAQLKLAHAVAVAACAIAAMSIEVSADTHGHKPAVTTARSTAHARHRPCCGHVACDEEAVMEHGKPQFPPEATDIQIDMQLIKNDDRGALADLYPDSDTTTDALYPLPCPPSLGGTLPAGAEAEPTEAEQEAEQYVANFDQDPEGAQKVVLQIQANPVKLPSIKKLVVGDCFIKRKPVNCNNPKFLKGDQPFEGRDIIYVHGLALEHLKKWLANESDAHNLWPQNSGAFIGPTGYFRLYAEKQWQDHIHENLFDPVSPGNSIAGYQWTPSDPGPVYRPKANRYLIVAWSSNQTLEYAQHAFLTQVKLAMRDGTNVVTPPTYPSGWVRPFCSNGCIVISHSTGGLLVSSALARAQAGEFGPGAKTIPDHIRIHVALNGAISGSRLASAAMALGIGFAVPTAAAQTILCPIEDVLFDTSGTCALNTGFVVNTILRDLIPLVSQVVWGQWVGASPVPTLTVTGGHPVGNYALGLTKVLLPGIDDGVVTMNSACGNPLPVYPPLIAASGVIVISNIKAYDMGVPTVRGIKNFLDQKSYKGPPPATPYMAGACQPWLSTTGMIMPVVDSLGSTPFDARTRYANHFSFVQSAADHSHMGGSDASNPWPSALGQGASTERKYLDFLGTSNREEMSAITNPNIYAMASDGTFLVKPDFAGQMHEYVRGFKCCSFKLFGKRHTWWIWKRTYHLLNHWPQKDAAHYVYEYVGRR